jgi:hypothetical protein
LRHIISRAAIFAAVSPDFDTTLALLQHSGPDEAPKITSNAVDACVSQFARPKVKLKEERHNLQRLKAAGHEQAGRRARRGYQYAFNGGTTGPAGRSNYAMGITISRVPARDSTPDGLGKHFGAAALQDTQPVDDCLRAP